MLNPIEFYEKWGIDSSLYYLGEYLIEDISNNKNKDVKNIWNIIDKMTNNDNEGIFYFSIESVYFIKIEII